MEGPLGGESGTGGKGLGTLRPGGPGPKGG